MKEKDFLEKAQRIKAFIFDVDGVLTDGTLYYTPAGEVMKRFFVQDGVAIKMLMDEGIEVGIISAKDSKAALHRLKELGIENIYMGAEDKYEVYIKFLNEKGLSEDVVCYMGDDVPDLQIMKKTALSFAPANACMEVKEAADYVTEKKGGEGAVREAIEILLKAKGKWEKALSKFLKKE